MKRLLCLCVIMLAPLTAYSQEELSVTGQVAGAPIAPAGTKFSVGTLLLDWKNERVVGQLVNEVKTIGDPGKAGTLTVRTSNSVGTLTMGAADHGIVTGQEINVAWAGGLFRRNMVAGTVAGAVIPISGGKGDQLPTVSSAITAPATLTRTFGVELPPIEWIGAKARKFLRDVNKGGTLPGGSAHAYWLQQVMKDDPKLVGTVGGTPD